jgi:hypothetical protein
VKFGRYFLYPWLLGLSISLAFVFASALLPLACATVTDPPPSWPNEPSCAQDPSQPWCAGNAVHDEKRDR